MSRGSKAQAWQQQAEQQNESSLGGGSWLRLAEAAVQAKQLHVVRVVGADRIKAVRVLPRVVLRLAAVPLRRLDVRRPARPRHQLPPAAGGGGQKGQ